MEVFSNPIVSASFRQELSKKKNLKNNSGKFVDILARQDRTLINLTIFREKKNLKIRELLFTF